MLILDGHASLNSLEWLQYGSENNVEIVRLPANTIHFLQPCDQAINRVFKQSIRAARDELLSNCHIGFANVTFKLKVAAAGYKAITKPVIEKSFLTAGLWPVNYRFVSAVQNKVKGRGTPFDTFCGHSPRSDTFALQQLHQMKKREADRRLPRLVRENCDNSFSPSSALSEITLLTTSKYFTYTILQEQSGPTRTQTTSPLPNWALVGGKEAKHLTVKNLLEEFEQRKAKKASGGGSRLTVRRNKQVGHHQGIEKENCGFILRSEPDICA